MQETSTSPAAILQFRQDIEAQFRRHIREALGLALKEELAAPLEERGLAARAAYDAFVKKWATLCPAVAKSLEEAGLELPTFYDFPKAMWKSLRTTNTLENLNREFRRRTKTQASFGSEAGALIILLWARCVRSDPAAEDRPPHAAAVICCKGMAESRVRT